jgi:hypothetical protein
MIPGINDIHCAIGDGRKKFVITGCGRSGTLYVRKLFLKLGVDLGHEGFRKDGIVSWYIAEPTRAEFVRSYFNRNFPDTVYIHLIRDPLKVIQSMYKLTFLPNRAGLDFFNRAYPQYDWMAGTLSHVMMWYVIWNQNCEIEYPTAERWRIEDLSSEEALPHICHLANVEFTSEIVHKIKNLSKRTHTLGATALANLERKKVKDLTFEDLHKEAPNLAQRIKVFAHKYGYEI